MFDKLKQKFPISFTIICIFLLLNYKLNYDFFNEKYRKVIFDKNIPKPRRNKTKEEIKATFEHREKVMKLG